MYTLKKHTMYTYTKINEVSISRNIFALLHIFLCNSMYNSLYFLKKTMTDIVNLLKRLWFFLANLPRRLEVHQDL